MDRRPGLLGDLERHRLPGLLLNNRGSRPEGSTQQNVLYANLDDVTAAELAVDRQVEER